MTTLHCIYGAIIYIYLLRPVYSFHGNDLFAITSFFVHPLAALAVNLLLLTQHNAFFSRALLQHI
jgi:hypothetical protein